MLRRDGRGDHHAHRDSDHREWSGDFQEEDETDYQAGGRGEEDGESTKRVSSAPWEKPLSPAGGEDRDAVGTTDPLLAHELLTPYSCVPRPRLFRAFDEDDEYVALPGRPRSPVRHILPGRFHLGMEGLLKRRGVANARRYLRGCKVRISQSVKQASMEGPDVDRDSIICMLTLQAVCEQVTLTTAGVNTGIDVRTFVNMAIIWAMVDLQILDLDVLDKRERAMFVELGLSPDLSARPKSRQEVETVETSKLRRALFEARRPDIDLCISMQLYRHSPLTPVSPVNHRDVVKSYPNVRERISERLADERSTYVLDVTCRHFKEVSEESFAARKRKSKILSGSSENDMDELPVQFHHY